METIIKSVRDLSISDEEKSKYIRFVQDQIKKSTTKYLKKRSQRLSSMDTGNRRKAFSTIISIMRRHIINRTRIKDSNTGEELEPDERFMRSIEEQIGITEASAKGFRADVTAYMFFVIRSGGKLDYCSYEPLKEAIEKKLTSSVKELSRIITRAKVRDEEQDRKYNTMVEEMKRNGYCDHCCNVVLKYAANNLWKD
jgi:serine protein kinase